MSWKKYPKLFKNLRQVQNLSQAAFSEKYLLITNVLVAFCAAALGDAFEQSYEISRSSQRRALDGPPSTPQFAYNFTRSRNMGITGMATGGLCHYWYSFLDQYLPGNALRVVAKKILMDQIAFTPICISTFLIIKGLLDRESAPRILSNIKEKEWVLYRADWLFAMPAQFLNFYLLPTKYRVLFESLISMVQSIYASYVLYDGKEVTKGES